MTGRVRAATASKETCGYPRLTQLGLRQCFGMSPDENPWSQGEHGRPADLGWRQKLAVNASAAGEREQIHAAKKDHEQVRPSPPDCEDATDGHENGGG